MTRYEREDAFIKKMALIAQYNPDLIMNAFDVYANLTRIDINDKEVKANEKFFNSWIEYFNNVPDIDVFVNQSFSYFCQFVNNPERTYNCNIKMYIPLDKEHIERGAISIFSFMAQQGITHQSKIGKDIRNDDIVIRVERLEDAFKIQSYVDSNKYIQEGKIPLSPFSISNGAVAYAMDDSISYNIEVATNIWGYLNALKKDNRLNDASIEGFRNYVSDVISAVSITGDGLREYMKSRDIFGDFDDVTDKLVNHVEVMKLIYKASSAEASLHELMNHRVEVLSTEKREQDRKQIQQVLLKVSGTKVDKSGDKSEILGQATIETYKKYGENWIKTALGEYIKKGETRGFTREKDSRMKVSVYLTPTDAEVMAINPETNLLDIDGYVDSVVKKYKEELAAKNQILASAVHEIHNMYGFDSAVKSVISYIENKGVQGFAETDQAKNLVISNLTPEDVRELVTNPKTKQEEVMTYVNNVISKPEVEENYSR